jgi:hypothetical protein
MINKYLNFLLLIATFVLSTDSEINLFENSGISLELIILFLSYILNISILKEKLRTDFSQKYLYVSIILFLFIIILIKDLIFGNYRAFYSLVFFLLLYSFVPIFYHPLKNLKNYISIALILFLGRAFLFPEQLEGFDYLDTVGEERTYRLRILGFESNVAGIIFSSVFVYSLAIFNNTKKRFEKILYAFFIILSAYLTIKTFSRASYLTVLISITFLYYKYLKFYIISIPIVFILIYYFYVNDLISPVLVERVLSIYDINNPRFGNWNFAFNDFKSNFPVSLFCGIGFFKHAMDNTYLNLFFSLGIFTFAILFFLSLKVFHVSVNSKYSFLLFFILFFNFLFIDAFAQRKALLIVFFLITSLEKSCIVINEKLR